MNKYKLYGAILGDLAGQPYEFPAMKGPYTNVNLHNPNSVITYDTIMTLATAAAIIQNAKTNQDYAFAYKLYGCFYGGDHYGKTQVFTDEEHTYEIARLKCLRQLIEIIKE